MSKHPHQTVVIQPASTSGLAIAGLIFSILGWFTCGLLCIPGAFFCLLALFSRGPKGTAIAGLIVGFPGTLLFAFVGLGMIMGFLGLGAASTSAVRDADRSQSQSHDAVQTPAIPSTTDKPPEESPPSASPETSDEVKPKGSLETKPNPSADSPLVPSPAVKPATSEKPDVYKPARVPDPDALIDAAKWRIWTTADGNYKVDAKFVKFAAGTLTLEKRDGSTVDVKLDILCPEDQDFVRQRKWTRAASER